MQRTRIVLFTRARDICIADGHPIKKSAACVAGRLGARGLDQIRNQVATLLWLLQAGKDHLGALDVLLRSQEVLEQRLVCPRDARVLVGRRVRIAFGLTRLTVDHAVEVGALLVGAALVRGVALRAFGLEDLGSFDSVSFSASDVHRS